MKTIRLPQTESDKLHLECYREDGSSYVIETRRCHIIQVEDDIVDVVMTQLTHDRRQLRLSKDWKPAADTNSLAFKQKVDIVLA